MAKISQIEDPIILHNYEGLHPLLDLREIRQKHGDTWIVEYKPGRLSHWVTADRKRAMKRFSSAGHRVDFADIGKDGKLTALDKKGKPCGEFAIGKAPAAKKPEEVKPPAKTADAEPIFEDEAEPVNASAKRKIPRTDTKSCRCMALHVMEKDQAYTIKEVAEKAVKAGLVENGTPTHRRMGSMLRDQDGKLFTKIRPGVFAKL